MNELNLIKVTPDKEKAKSMLKMIKTTIDMITYLDIVKFSSNITKEYYDVLRELMSIVLLLDGYKVYGEEAHKKTIEYIEIKYKTITEAEINLLNDLRIKRNKISYDGFFIEPEYIKNKLERIKKIIIKLEKIISLKL